ncbi:ricin-type beta-trefoil lectin domain protein [Kitasatospora sp. NPDC101157]|uniref:ricin-type beta-trefoil lectin domain protein n=1 Tax=Kitasatospora sp. NPDC101157 TaxID=3364098 RepID=UPI00380D3F70
MTTEASRTVANPNGTLTTTDNSQPVRTKRPDGWSDLDATLRANSDGTVTPTVASTAVTFSGGGSGPMATVVTQDGKKLSVEAPFLLPRPTLSGATATYSDVLPGVDIQLTALTVGGWRDVIVVRSADAATNPALKTLRFPLKGEGLITSATDAGVVEVKDDRGGVRFRSPAPLQWDSARPTATAQPAKAATAARNDPGAPPAPPASTSEAPGEGANVAAISAKVVDNALELTPDQGALRSGTGPWYLDPTLTAVTSYTEGSVQVQENYKTAENYNKKSDLSTGYCGYHSSNPALNCAVEGRERAYFQFRVNAAIYTKPAGAEFTPTVFSSTLNGQVSEASSMGTPTDLGVYSAPQGKTIHEHSNWNDQPCGTNGNLAMNDCAFVGGQRITGTGPLAVDVTDAMKQAAAGQWSVWTVGIAPQTNEWDRLFRHKIASNPSVTTTYDINPTVWYPRTSPVPGFAGNRSTAECTSGGARPWDNPGWVGNNQNILLTVNSWSPTGQSLYTGFHMWDDNDPNFSYREGGWSGSYNNPGYTVSVGSLSDGHQYGWYGQAGDGALDSPGSAWCYFRVDRTNPRVSISSPDFPPSGTPNDHPTRYANDTEPGTFLINAEDPAPGPDLRASGVACVRFSTDQSPVTGWQCGQPGTYSPGTPVKFRPTTWGTNTVYAWAMDNAGNYSQRADYSFYAPWKPGSVPVFGDTDGDQLADIIVPDATGNLRTIGGDADPARAVTASAASAPRKDVTDTTTTWTDYQLSHRGTLNETGALDQIVAHNTKDASLKRFLFLIDNDGTGRYDTYSKISLDRPTTTTCAAVPTAGLACPTNRPFAGDWSEVSQLLSLGTPDGELTSTTAATPTSPVKTSIISQTSLLTVEGGRLWLHNVSGAKWNQVDATALLIPTAPNSGTWDDYELLNPGPANGTTVTPGQPDARQATLWARHRTNGNIYAYPITRSPDGRSDFSALTRPNGGALILNNANWTTAAQPRIGAADLNGDGIPDLWAINTKNAITVFPGKSSPGSQGKVDGFDTWQLLGYSDSSVSLHPNLVAWQCMDAWGGPRDGAPLAIGSCWNTANQRFNLSIDGTIRAGAYCVSTLGGANTNGTQLSLATCDGRPTQKWSVRPDGRIINQTTITGGDPNTGRCIELNNWHTEQGTRLDIWDCPGLADNSRWTVQPERNP